MLAYPPPMEQINRWSLADKLGLHLDPAIDAVEIGAGMCTVAGDDLVASAVEAQRRTERPIELKR